MTGRSPRCSTTSRSFDEPLAGTASTVTRWLLVEHPPAWAADALESRGLPAEVARFLASLWPQFRIRVLLVRRRSRTRADHLHCFAAWTGARDPWVGRTHLGDVRQLLDLDLAPLAEGSAVGFEAHSDPMFLVCTHGSHDTCCGLIGRPVADALSEWWPADTWECTHIGGDRFAANVVCLPEGIYYGRVEPAEVEALVDRYHEGRLLLERYRGRSCYSVPEQAAEISVRREFEIDTFAGVRPVASRRVDRHEWVVTVAVEARSDPIHADVTVTLGHADQDRPLTCGGDPGSPRTVQVRRRVT